MKWKWFQRRGGIVDQVGPATVYPHRSGGYGARRHPDGAEHPDGDEHPDGERPDGDEHPDTGRG